MSRTLGSVSDLFDIDPYAFYDEVRRQTPVYWDAKMNGWLVVSYEHCRFVETNEGLFRHASTDADEITTAIKGGRRNVTILTGSEHQKLHRFLVSLFSPKELASYRPNHIRPVVSFLVERFACCGRAELAGDFADQLPARVMSSLFGLDWRDDELMLRQKSLSDIVFSWIGAVDRGEAATHSALDAARELDAFLLPVIRSRRLASGDDLISRMWARGEEGLEGMGEADVLTSCRELYLDGTDTTGHALSNAIYQLLIDVSLRQLVERDKESLGRFVEESLRIFGSVQYRFRRANQDIELAGVQIGKDDLVMPVNSAANRDPVRYERPAEVNLDRPQLRQHLAFNLGPRTCVGAALARAVMHDGLSAVLALPRLRLDPDAPAPVFRNLYLRSFRPLHTRFDTDTASARSRAP